MHDAAEFVANEKLMGHAFVRHFKNNSAGWFVRFDGGDGYFSLGNERSNTNCCDGLSWGSMESGPPH